MCKRKETYGSGICKVETHIRPQVVNTNSKTNQKRTFEIIQASTEHDLASKIFDICLIVLVKCAI